MMKKIDVSKLRNPNTPTSLAEDLDNQLSELQLEGTALKDRECRIFQDIVHSFAIKVLGLSYRKEQDWFDENDEDIRALFAEKHRLHLAHQNDPSSAAKKRAFNNTCRAVQSKRRKMQDSWLSAIQGQKFAKKQWQTVLRSPQILVWTSALREFPSTGLG